MFFRGLTITVLYARDGKSPLLDRQVVAKGAAPLRIPVLPLNITLP
jgi:hypothetical protein